MCYYYNAPERTGKEPPDDAVIEICPSSLCGVYITDCENMPGADAFGFSFALRQAACFVDNSSGSVAGITGKGGTGRWDERTGETKENTATDWDSTQTSTYSRSIIRTGLRIAVRSGLRNLAITLELPCRTDAALS